MIKGNVILDSLPEDRVYFWIICNRDIFIECFLKNPKSYYITNNYYLKIIDIYNQFDIYTFSSPIVSELYGKGYTYPSFEFLPQVVKDRITGMRLFL